MFDALGKFKSQQISNEYQNRKTSGGDMVYPWNNYDFDYSGLVANKYNPKKMGFSNKPLIGTTVKDITTLPEYPKILVTQPIPNNSVIAGKSDVDPNNDDLLEIKQKYNDEFKPPYPSFKNDYKKYLPLTGENSSSYFLKVGTCPIKGIKSKKECIKKGYNWVSNAVEPPEDAKGFFPQNGNVNTSTDSEDDNTPGACFKPRFMFIDNRPKGVSGLKGMVTNLANDISELNPMGLVEILMTGKSSNKNLMPIPCEEGFTTKDDDSIRDRVRINFIICLVTIFFLFMLLFLGNH